MIIKYILKMNTRAFKFISVYWALASSSYLAVFKEYEIEEFFGRYWFDGWSVILFPVVFVYIGRLFYEFYKK